ncbi:hypothetical protein M5689_012977 [Euphorbia peplus]|nr:hypothetical protein M5689_012977 [Euphorbia peplus]
MRPLRKRDFILTSAPELEDDIPEEEEEGNVNDDGDIHMDDVAEGDFGAPIFEEVSEDTAPEGDFGAPIFEEVSEDTAPEGDFDEVQKVARVVADEDPNFMDDVLLGQG